MKYYILLCLSLLILCTGCAGIAHAEEISEQFADAPAEVDFLNPGNLQEIPADPEPEEIPGYSEIPEDSEIPETVPVNPLRERVDALYSENSGNFKYLIDEEQILSESVREAYETILAQKNIYLLITNHLDGLSPGRFAEQYHQALLEYSENSENFDSIFILINNDTYQDVFHVSGEYATEFYAEQLRIAILQATPALVEGRYEDALEIFCNLF